MVLGQTTMSRLLLCMVYVAGVGWLHSNEKKHFVDYRSTVGSMHFEMDHP